MKTRLRTVASLVSAVAAFLVASVAPAFAQQQFQQLRLIAPAAPGGGWDQTARAMQQVLQRSGLVGIAPVENIPGAAGTIGLARFIGAERGNGDTLMISGLIMLGGIVTNDSPVTMGDATPIARLTGEYEVIVVPAASPWKTLDDFIAAFKANPRSISWGGGSAGGSDQILAGLFAEAVGVKPSLVNYIAFSGGGESLSAILGGQVSVGINGLAELEPQIEAGTVRALAISSGARLDGVNAPTLKEQGVNIEFENWRSVMAPPGISAEQRARYEKLIDSMVHSPEWRETLTRFRWIDRYLTGPPYAEFVASEEVRVRDILQELGTGRRGANSLADAGPYPLFVLAGLIVFGAGAVIGIRKSKENAEHRWPKMRSIGLIAIASILNLVLAERAGFIIASTVLFWFAARAFDERHPLRDAVFAVGISLGAYLLFDRVLQLTLPAGVLAGWL